MSNFRHCVRVSAWRLAFDETLSESLVAWLSSEWGAWVDEAAVHADTLATVGAAAEPDFSELDLAAWSDLMVGGHAVRSCRSGRCTVLATKEGGASFELREALPANVSCWGRDPWLPLYAALTEVARADGWISLHASAFVPEADGGSACVLLGDSGAGKSFGLMRALRSGARPLAEDRLWVRADDMLAVGCDQHVHLRPDAFDFFPEIDRSAASMRSDGKFRFAYESLGAQASAPVPIGRVRILARGGQVMVGEDKPTLNTVQLIWQAVGMPLTPGGRQAASKVVHGLLARLEGQRPDG